MIATAALRREKDGQYDSKKNVLLHSPSCCICNAAVLSISILNATNGLQILVFNTFGLQIRMDGARRRLLFIRRNARRYTKQGESFFYYEFYLSLRCY